MKSRKKNKEPDSKKEERPFFGKQRDDDTFFQRKESEKEKDEDKEKEVQAKAETGTSGTTGSLTLPGLANTTGKGEPLPSASKSKMESGFGTGFEDVKIHKDPEAASLSDSLDAQAFTYGSDIYFNKGKFSPGTDEGDLLLAHELAHTLQQKGAASKGQDFDKDAESEADMAAIGVLQKGGKDNDAGIKKLARKGKGSKKLSLQRCSKKDTPAPGPAPDPEYMVNELKKEPEKKDTGRTINVRGPVNRLAVQQDFARIDILAEGGATPVDKKIGGKTTNVYELKAYVLGFTEDWVAKEFDSIFPVGTETTIEKNDDPKLLAIKALIEKYRIAHPNSFSKLQARNMLSSSCDRACIGTFNTGVENLYGNQTVTENKSMADSAFGTIDKLKEKKFITKAGQVGATYDASLKIPESESQITGDSIAGEMNTIVQSQEDGIHPFLLSVGNGYHSITIIFIKMGGKTEIIWRDQHWNESPDNQKPKTVTEIDDKIKYYLVMRAKSWAREYYNRKNSPQIGIYSDIPEGEKKEAAKKDAEKTVRQDLLVNRYGKLNPVDKKK